MTERILGYTDVISGRPGDAIAIKTSTKRDHVDLSFQRLRGPVSEAGETRIAVTASAAGRYPARHQPAQIGSALVVSHLPPLWSFAIDVAVMPTALDQHEQGVLSWCRNGSPGLFLSSQGVTLRIIDDTGGAHVVTLDFAFVPSEWAEIRAAYQSTSGLVEIEVTTRASATAQKAEHRIESALPAGLVMPPTPAAIGAGWSDGVLDAFFNGRIATPSVRNAARQVAAWDFPHSFTELTIPDSTGGGHDARVHNAPVRAVPGPNWTGGQDDPGTAPQHYNAMHFHEESIDDYGWETTATLVIPEDWTSGLYLAIVDDGQTRDELPLWIRPAIGDESATLFLVPTNTYVAHANDRRFVQASRNDSCLAGHPELGISIHDRHRDGAGCMNSSRLRPILNLRPGTRQLDADLELIGLLERAGISYSVATDEDLDREGIDALRPHRVVSTGARPEFCSRAMLDAIDAYVADGGRLAYRGDGSHRLISYAPHGRHSIEVRGGSEEHRNGSSGSPEAGSGHRVLGH